MTRHEEVKKEEDVFRHSYLRYFGYANESKLMVFIL